MKQLGLLALLCLAFSGCEVQQAISPATATSLRGRQLTTLVRYTPRFQALIGKEADPLGTTYTEAIGVTRKNGIEDPAIGIAQDLSQGFARHYRLQAAPPVTNSRVEDDATRIHALDPNADVVLDIWTEYWGYAPVGNGIAGCSVKYKVNLRLIDAREADALTGKRGKVIAEGECKQPSGELVGAIGPDELLRDGAKLLKAELRDAQSSCLDELQNVLGLSERTTD